MKKLLARTKKSDWAWLIFNLTLSVLMVIYTNGWYAIPFAFNAGHVCYKLVDDLLGIKQMYIEVVQESEETINQLEESLDTRMDNLMKMRSLVNHLSRENEDLKGKVLHLTPKSNHPMEAYVQLSNTIAAMENDYVRKSTYGNISPNEGFTMQEDIKSLQQSIDELKTYWPKALHNN